VPDSLSNLSPKEDISKLLKADITKLPLHFLFDLLTNSN
jgi:hypothetical protein